MAEEPTKNLLVMTLPSWVSFGHGKDKEWQPTSARCSIPAQTPAVKLWGSKTNPLLSKFVFSFFSKASFIVEITVFKSYMGKNIRAVQFVSPAIPLAIRVPWQLEATWPSGDPGKSIPNSMLVRDHFRDATDKSSCWDISPYEIVRRLKYEVGRL